MKKPVLFSLILTMILYVIPVAAQDTMLNQVLVGNGGIYGNPGNRVKFGRYNPAKQTYINFDSIPGSYTNFAYVDGKEVYMNADSFVFRYEIDFYKRLGVFKSVGVVDMARYNDVLFVLKGFGAQGAYVDILDTGSFIPVGTIPEITNEARDIAIVGDTAYITHNLPGTIDQFPPFKVFDDSIGYIAIIDLPNRKFVRNISLGETGAGANQIFVENDFLYTINSEGGTIGRYKIGTNVAATITTPNANKGAGITDGFLYAGFGQGIGSFNVNTLAIADTSIVNRPIEAMAMDTLARELYATYTDFFSYGSLGRYDINGNLIDSIKVGVSPQAVAMEYRQKPIAEFMANNTTPLALDTISFIDLSIYDPTHFEWTITPASFVFVNGTDKYSPNPEVSFTDTGIYTVRLIVSSVGAVDTAERVDYIRVETEQLDLNFDVTERNPVESDTVTFTPSYAFAPDSYRWYITPSDFHYVNGTDSLSEIIDVVFDKGGFFTVTLVGRSRFDTDSLEKFRYINVEGLIGITESSLLSFSIFPNPASDYIIIQFPGLNNNKEAVTLFAADGRKLISTRITGTEIKMDIPNLENGIYFIEISTGSGRSVEKVIKL